MATEEKQLLLRDLCARLPYGVICRLSVKGVDVFITEKLECGGLDHFIYGTMDVKPYLRPMSSMTKEERNELESLWKEDLQDYVAFIREGHGWSRDGLFKSMETRQLDWLLSRHFDVRGLIPKDLALVALDGMYKTE